LKNIIKLHNLKYDYFLNYIIDISGLYNMEMF